MHTYSGAHNIYYLKFIRSSDTNISIEVRLYCCVTQVVVDIPEHLRLGRPQCSAQNDCFVREVLSPTNDGHLETVRQNLNVADLLGTSSHNKEIPLRRQTHDATAAYLASTAGCPTGGWILLFRGDSPGACGGPKILSNPLLLKGNQCKIHRYRVASIKVSLLFCNANAKD